MAQAIRTGVIGVGKMGRHHARVYSELSGCDLVGVFDADRDLATSCARQYGCEAFPTLEALFDSGIEAVSVAVPTSWHASIVNQALLHGLHVLVEKPIAATPGDAVAMMEAAKAANRKLMVGHIERFNPAIQAIKESVCKDDIISINIVRVGPLPPRIKDAGVIIDLAVHDIDLVRFLLEDEIEAVYCVKSANIARYEDTASLLLRSSRGASAQITTNWITPYKSREIQVVTAEKLVKGDLLTMQVHEFSRFSKHDQSYIVKGLHVQYQEPLRSQLQAFMDCIRHDREPAVTAMDGLRAIEVASRAVAFGEYASVA